MVKAFVSRKNDEADKCLATIDWAAASPWLGTCRDGEEKKKHIPTSLEIGLPSWSYVALAFTSNFRRRG